MNNERIDNIFNHIIPKRGEHITITEVPLPDDATEQEKKDAAVLMETKWKVTSVNKRNSNGAWKVSIKATKDSITCEQTDGKNDNIK